MVARLFQRIIQTDKRKASQLRTGACKSVKSQLNEYQTRRSEALQLAKNARQDLSEEKKSITNLLLQCKTVCRYLGNSDENQWIDLELDGYYTDDDLTLAQIREAVPSYRVGNMMYYDTRNNPVLMSYE